MFRSPVLRSFAATAILVLGVATACGSGSSGNETAVPDGPPLTVVSVDEGFELTWNDTDSPQIQVQVETPLDQGWEEQTAWKGVPVDDAGDGPLRYDDVEAGKRYLFRIREDDAWSEPVTRIHVETVLPVIRITTEDPDPDFETNKEYHDGAFELEPDGAEGDSVNADMRIRARGNSTWVSVPDKKSYQIDFVEKQSILGMPEAKKWVLLANYLDPSQLRNWAAMQISRATDLAWTPQGRWVEVYLNGDYWGLYEMYEKIGQDKNKVDIDKLTPEVTGGDDITGGYLLQIAWGARPEKDGWITPHKVKIHVQRPKKKNTNDEQFTYIRDHVNDFEAALFSDDFTDPETGYRRYLDVDSFADLWIVQETSVNTDAYADSLYFYKQRGDDKLYFGPAWDFDTAFGTRLSLFTETDKPWFTTQPSHRAGPGDELIGERRWVIRIFEDQWFREQVAERWKLALPEIEKIPDELLEVAKQIEPAKENDQLRWKDTFDTVVGKHRYGDREPMDEPEFLADWLSERIAFITEHVETSIEDYPPK